MRTNYVLIDYESVQPKELAALDKEHFKVIVFVGANQTKLPIETVAALQHMGDRADYVRISGNGPNALDFHIAFYVGQLAAVNPQGIFHIISKDTGFDPLIQHLKSRNISAARSRDVSEIPLVVKTTTIKPKVTEAKTTAEKLAIVVTNLQHRGASKPRTVKTLSSTVSSIFQKQLSEHQVAALIKELETKYYIKISDTKVTYTLPA